eukprot:Pgem_evm1s2032
MLRLTDQGEVVVPFAFAMKEYNNKKENDTISHLPPLQSLKFQGELREEQVPMVDNIIGQLNSAGSCVVSLHVGAERIQLRTLIVVNRIVLMKQWEDSINQFLGPGHVLVLKKDFAKFSLADLEKRNTSLSETFRKQFGLVIADECHLLVSEISAKSFLYLQPQFLLGLSATAYRLDGLSELLRSLFGFEIVEKKLHKKHLVYKIKTTLTPPIHLNDNGSLNWNKILEYQCLHEERNQFVSHLAHTVLQDYHRKCVLILTKRIDQADQICACLSQYYTEDQIGKMYGKNNVLTDDILILVGTVSKCGTGFDFKKLDTLIIAADLANYFIQFLGRVMRTPESEPMIFDIVDNNNTLENHWRKRRKIYADHGAIFKQFKSEFTTIQSDIL